MPFGVVRGVGRGMGVLDGVLIIEGEGAVLGVNLRHPIVTNGAFAMRSFQITLRTCCLCFRAVPNSQSINPAEAESVIHEIKH